MDIDWKKILIGLGFLGGATFLVRKVFTSPKLKPGPGPGGRTSMQPPAASGMYTGTLYAPHASVTVDLFTSALKYAGLPEAWAKDTSLHELLRKESGGYVGRPNYQFGDLARLERRSEWWKVWAAIKAGTWKSLIGAQYPEKSSATGLGQLTITNIASGNYYPSGVDGIGKPLEEAIGMVRYIKQRYNTPQAALTFHLAHNWY